MRLLSLGCVCHRTLRRVYFNIFLKTYVLTCFLALIFRAYPTCEINQGGKDRVRSLACKGSIWLGSKIRLDIHVRTQLNLEIELKAKLKHLL